ncbi:MAG TPA: hypothetical protein VMO47_11175 [Rhodothermales bacterium]|nr:hypothetical protein [Rhodothermales bacterium]
MVQRYDRRLARDEIEEYEPGIPLGGIVRIIVRYRYPIVLSVAAVLLLYGVIAGVVYLFGPSQRVASIPFRLEFTGAGQGLYPNGTRFSTSDIVATPILTKVYDTNDLSRFLPYRTFADSIFVVESNEAVENLAREYSARLDDKNLTTVDRERIQEEYRLKRASLSRADYSINFMIGGETRKLPRSLVPKILDQIMSEWARYAKEERGAARYATVLLTENIISQQQILTEEPIIALDILRSKINEVIRNIDQLLRVPGAEVLRAGDQQISLAELRVQLEDLVRLRLNPLTIQVHSDGITSDRDSTMRFLDSQLAYNERRFEEATARVERVREALETYQGGGRPAIESTAAAPARSPASGGGDVVMPQIGESFLQQIVGLSGLNADREYRQGLVDEMKRASLETIPVESEIQYYRNIVQILETTPVRGTGGEQESARIRDDLRAILGEVLRSIQQVNAIYDLISTNINSTGSLYTTTAPPSVRVERATSPIRLALIGFLLLLVTIPAAIAGALLHARVTDEAEFEGDEMTTEGLVKTESLPANQ